MAVISLLLVIAMHLLNLVPARKREKTAAEEWEGRGIGRQWGSGGSPASRFRPWKQSQIPLDSLSGSAWASGPPWCFLLICAFCKQLKWIFKWSLLKRPLFTEIRYSRLSAWQLPEMLNVGSNLPLLPAKIACKWDTIFLFLTERSSLSDGFFLFFQKASLKQMGYK